MPPAFADIGDEVGLALIGNDWGLSQAGASNLVRIMDVLDIDGRSVQESGGTGVSVVFVIVAHQNLSHGTADAPAA